MPFRLLTTFTSVFSCGNPSSPTFFGRCGVCNNQQAVQKNESQLAQNQRGRSGVPQYTASHFCGAVMFEVIETDAESPRRSELSNSTDKRRKELFYLMRADEP